MRKYKRKRSFSRARLLVAILAFLVFILLSSLKPAFAGSYLKNNLGIWFNTTASYPLGFYKEVSREARRGDYVVFCLPFLETSFALKRSYLEKGLCKNASKPLIKKVYGVGGDLVSINKRGVSVGELKYPGLKPRLFDSKGRELRPYFGVFKTNRDEFWLFSEYDGRSWDSRYFGPVDRSQVLSVVEAVFLIGS